MSRDDLGEWLKIVVLTAGLGGLFGSTAFTMFRMLDRDSYQQIAIECVRSL